MKYFHQSHQKSLVSNKNVQYSLEQPFNKSNQKKQYLAVFQQVKQIGSKQNSQNHSQDDMAEQISSKIKNTVKIMNQPQNLSLFQINKCLILLGSLISINQKQIYNLTIKKNFIRKIGQFLSQFSEEYNEAQGIEDECKIALLHTFLYIVVLSISSKDKIGQQSNFKTKLFKDKHVLNAFLNIKIFKAKNIGKLYGITAIYISKLDLSKKFQQKLMNSILSNFSLVNHQKTQLNMLMILRELKNKYSIHSSLIKNGRLIEKLKNVFLISKTYYQSFFSLDLLLHLKSKFPVFSKQILQSKIVFKITDPQNVSFISTNNFTIQTSLRYLKEATTFIHQEGLLSIIIRNLSIIKEKNQEKSKDNSKNTCQKQSQFSLPVLKILMQSLTNEAHLFKIFNQGFLETLVKSLQIQDQQVQKDIISVLSIFLKNITLVNQNIGLNLKAWTEIQIREILNKQFSAGQFSNYYFNSMKQQAYQTIASIQ